MPLILEIKGFWARYIASQSLVSTCGGRTLSLQTHFLDNRKIENMLCILNIVI